MSLFKLRDLWSTKCGKNEVFDQGSLLVADIRGENQQYMLVGSHSGCLRIFNPQLDLESGDFGNFKPIDLMIEVQLEQPILQLAVGKFVSGSKIEYLAVLHPRSLAVYNFIAVSGSTEHGDQCEVNLMYEHHLKRSAYRLVTGRFGGVENRDFACVLGLDGTLMFYEQETLTSTRQLPGYLLPSPIVYIPHTDSFIVLSSDWHLQSYRYQSLCDEGPVSPSWVFNLGEEALDLHFIPITTTLAGILILTHRNFFCFNETGNIRFSKRLQYVPVCSHVYSRGETTVMLLVVSDSNDLLVYEDFKLVWAAQLHLSPIAISRFSLQVLPGCLVILTEEGDLVCGYLGTEASLFMPPPLPASVTADSQLETKLSGLQHQIAAYSLSQKESLGAPGEKKDLKVTAKVWEVRGESIDSYNLEISLASSVALQSVNIAIDCPRPLVVEPQTHFLQNITENVEVMSRVRLESGIVWDVSCSVVCVYLCGEQAGVSSAQVDFPLPLVLDIAPPKRGLDFVLNLSASQVAILPALFPDFNVEGWKSSGCNEHLAAFRYRGMPEVGFTITLNRPGLKFRLEADSISALTLPVCVLARKLAGKHLRSTQYSLPLTDLFKAVDQNIEMRNTIRRVEKELKAACSQMRACQRRLLAKMRDKIPPNLQPLTELINHTHTCIMDASYSVEAAQNALEENGFLLGNLIKLTTMLIKMTGTASDDEVDNLYEALAYTHHLSDEQGWAEITHIALANLLKTTLARSVRDQFGGEPQEKVVSESLRLKKQIATAIDRIVKGQHRFSDRGVSPIPEDEEGRERTDGSHQELDSEELKKIIEEAEFNLEHL